MSDPDTGGPGTDESGPARAVLPPSPMLATPKRRPKRLLIAAGVLVVVIGALAAYWVSQSAARRVDVVAVSRDVQWGEQITAADLRRAQIVADPGIDPVPWSQASSLIGQYARSKLWAGSLMSPSAVTSKRILDPDEAIIGLAVKEGQMPASPLQPGDRITLVTVPQPNSTGEVPPPVAATIYRLAQAVSGGATPVDVVVPQGQAARLATDSSQGRIVIVLLPRG